MEFTSVFSRSVRWSARSLAALALPALALVIAACGGASEPETVEVVVEKEVIKEVPVEKVITKEVPVEVVVEKEIIKEVPVDVVREVIKEVPVEVVKEVVIEVPVPVEVPVEVVVEKEVIKEVPVEVVKEVIKEVPVEVVKEVIKEVPVEVVVEKEVVKEVSVVIEGEKTYAVVDAVKSISAGGFHTCALREGDEAVCWGNNEDGQSTVPDGRFAAISAGGWHTCALRLSGEAMCWGRNRFGESDAPEGTFRAISAGDNFTCALRDNNAPLCWGDPLIRPSESEASVRFRDISSGGSHACGLTLNSGISNCWGNNEDGQRLYSPARITEFQIGLTGVSTGGSHTYILKGGRFLSSGRNEEGQRSTGGVILEDERVDKISAGYRHTCAVIVESLRVACWGQNNRGQASPPVGRFIEVSAGRFHSCGVLETGEAVCWGYDESGQATPRFP